MRTKTKREKAVRSFIFIFLAFTFLSFTFTLFLDVFLLDLLFLLSYSIDVYLLAYLTGLEHGKEL